LDIYGVQELVKSIHIDATVRDIVLNIFRGEVRVWPLESKGEGAKLVEGSYEGQGIVEQSLLAMPCETLPR
jgi:hypothetical protein